MSQDIVVTIPREDTQLATLLTTEPNLNAVIIPGAGMDGGGGLIVVLLPFSHFAAKILVDIIKANWERAKHVKVEMEGMSFSGASLDEIAEFIDRQRAHHEQEQRTPLATPIPPSNEASM
jgi:hypothetical protein